MPIEPCRVCGDPRPVSRKSLSPPTCQKCRRLQPKPAGYIAPSRRGQCSQCGNVVQVTWSSAPAERRKCRECKWGREYQYKPKPPYKPQKQWTPQLVTCPCGVVFEQHRWGQKYCRAEHRLEPKRGPRPSTTARGYGHRHQKQRAEALAVLIPGTACPRCDEPMTADQALDLDHTDDRQDYLGLSHTTCNRSAGAVVGNRMRGRRQAAA